MLVCLCLYYKNYVFTNVYVSTISPFMGICCIILFTHTYVCMYKYKIIFIKNYVQHNNLFKNCIDFDLTFSYIQLIILRYAIAIMLSSVRLYAYAYTYIYCTHKNNINSWCTYACKFHTFIWLAVEKFYRLIT